MGFSCAVVGCSNNSARNNNVKFFSLPAVKMRQGSEIQELTQRRQTQWLSHLNRRDIKPTSYKYTRVCAEHFVRGRPAYEMNQTDVDWAPTLNLGHSKINRQTVARSLERYERMNARRKKAKRSTNTSTAETGSAGANSRDMAPPSDTACEDAILNLSQDGNELSLPSPDDSTPVKPSSVTPEIHTQTSACDVDRLDAGLRDANEQIYKLRQKVDDLSTNEDSFRNDDEKVQFYTGLPNFCVLMCVFNFVAPFVTVPPKNVLSQFQELLMVLIKLRLNTPFQDLAYRFAVSASTASHIFDRWIPVLDGRLSHLIFWPEREILRNTMPLSFRQSFGDKVAVIIHCFEVFIDRPSTLSARAMTWSNYKHHNTAKFLIGITPQGVISFISKAWGGRASDEHITENCSVLTNLLPGDFVLRADKGCDVADSVGYYGFYCAKLASPALTRGKAQLSALEIEETRKIANFPIHVERVIGLLQRKYPILQSTLPIETVMCKEGHEDTPLDMIVRVCCALSNMCL